MSRRDFETLKIVMFQVVLNIYSHR